MKTYHFTTYKPLNPINSDNKSYKKTKNYKIKLFFCYLIDLFLFFVISSYFY
jgi:hypothetical protein